MHKILIVEDDPNLLEGYEIIFVKEGYQVSTASNGQEALAQLEKDTPDIIILDMMMPLMSGIEFLQKLDKPHRYPNMKVIVFSNMSEAGGTKVALELGADKYMIKSNFSPKELVALVHETIGESPPTPPPTSRKI